MFNNNNCLTAVDADSVCEIYTSISKCPEKQHCHADNGQPMCRWDSGDNYFKNMSQKYEVPLMQSHFLTEVEDNGFSEPCLLYFKNTV